MKTCKLLLCRVSMVLVRTKYITCVRATINCTGLVIPNMNLNFLIFDLRLTILNIKVNSKIHANSLNLFFWFFFLLLMTLNYIQKIPQQLERGPKERNNIYSFVSLMESFVRYFVLVFGFVFHFEHLSFALDPTNYVGDFVSRDY